MSAKRQATTGATNDCQTSILCSNGASRVQGDKRDETASMTEQPVLMAQRGAWDDVVKQRRTTVVAERRFDTAARKGDSRDEREATSDDWSDE